MKDEGAGAILRFTGAQSSSDKRSQRKDFLRALHSSGSPLIVDLSDCRTLNHEDIAFLLECLMQVAGRDTKAVLVAGSRANRVLLELTRIASLAPVFDSLEEALAHSAATAETAAPKINAAEIKPREATNAPGKSKNKGARP